MAYVVILAVLAVLWVAVIGSWVRERAQSHQGDSTLAFRQQLHTLQRTQPGSPRSAASRPAADPLAKRIANDRRSLAEAEMRRRRRDVLTGLLVVAGITFLAAAFTGSVVLIGLNVLCDLAAAAFILALVQQQRLATEQQVKVRHLPSSAGLAAPRLPAAAARTRSAGARPAAQAVRPGRVAPSQLATRPARIRATGTEAAFAGRSATS